MPGDRLLFALERVRAEDWGYFERFAAEFLSIDFPSLRTTATPSGDRGRDGFMQMPGEESTVAVQYSVTAEWRSKINDTVRTLAREHPQVLTLIYATNQRIGADADLLRTSLRARGINLDIRDRSWFADREFSAEQRRVAAEELARRFVDPLLSARGIGERVAPILDSEECRLAVLQLSLEGYDSTTNKSLTKSSFEALVKSQVTDTTATSHISIRDLVTRVSSILPAGHSGRVEEQVRGAVRRLSGANTLKYFPATDEVHLSNAERVTFLDRSVRFSSNQSRVLAQLAAEVSSAAPSLDESRVTETSQALLAAIETILMDRGERFAHAVATGDMNQINGEEVLQLLASKGVALPGLSEAAVSGILLDLLTEPTPDLAAHLRSLADGYTLFAFLRQTPDVQGAFTKVFSDGDIWLDASVIVPLLAETLINQPERRRFTILLRAARDAGMRLFVTNGVVEEVERNINRALSFSRVEVGEWRSEVPLLYSAYTLAGRGRSTFAAWLREFRGESDPEGDVRRMLSQEYGVTVRDLADQAAQVDADVRGAVEEVWHEARERKGNTRNTELTPASALRLVAHDVENSLGVIQIRRRDTSDSVGFRAWWLTFDKTAYTLEKEIKDRTGKTIKSPVLSPDFLTELLRLGPLRASLSRELHVTLPILLDIGRYENLPPVLIELADEKRRQLAAQSERVTERDVRDLVNSVRWREGPIASDGADGVMNSVRSAIRAR